MITILLLIAIILFAGISIVSAVFNITSPVQLGPIPVIGGALLAIFCIIWVIALHLVWR